MLFKIESSKLILTVSLFDSDLTIVGEDRADIMIEAAELRKQALDEKYKIDFKADTLTIKEQHHKWFNFFSRSSKGHSLVLKVPKHLQIAVGFKGYNSNFKINSASFSGEVKSYSGDVTIDSCVVTLDTLKIYSGDISIVKSSINLMQDTSIATMSGDIELKKCDLVGDKLLTIKTMSGNVQLDPELADHQNIKVKSASNFKMDFKFEHGFEHQEKKSNSSQEINSVSKILDMLESGKISAKEAEQLIKAIKG